jgi:cytochrome P450
VPPAFLTTETFENPYPLARELRDRDPVHWSPEFGAFVLTRYADVAASLHDPRLAADRLWALDRLAEFGMEHLRPLFTTMRRMFLFRDPPDHTRLRKIMNRAFTRPSVEGWRTETRRRIDELLDAAAERGRMDVLADVAQPLPLSVIRIVLGIPPQAEPDLRRWSEDISRFFGTFVHTHRLLGAVQRSVLEFTDYLRGLLDEKRRSAAPGADLLGALVHDTSDALTEDEIIANAILLVAAGHVTTTDLIGNSTLALLRDPALAAGVRAHAAEPAFVEAAVEELLRCESPVQMTARLVRQDLEIGGRQIHAGQWVVLWLGAANRDPARFPDPDRIQLTRTDNRHVAFGAGAHFCIGAPLARMQAQLLLPTLFTRFLDLRLEDVPLVWEQNPTLRGLTALPVLLG